MSMGQMSIDAFLFECNNSNLLKDYRSTEKPITKSILNEADLIKPVYSLHDLEVLRRRLSFIEPYVPKGLELNKVTFKNLVHWYEIGKLYNQKFLINLRKEVGMAFPNRGFKIDKDYLPEQTRDYSEHFTNTFLDDGFSQEFKEWFSEQRRPMINAAVERALLKWKLQVRYKPAIRELILFNRIIPASSGISWVTALNTEDGRYTEAIQYDADTTKQQIRDELKGSRMLYLNQKRMQGKRRNFPRGYEDTKKMIDSYNRHKYSGEPDHKIFKALHFEFPKYKESAIKKRIKG